MTTLILVRHGNTEWNGLRRAQGHADIALDDIGRAQAEAAADELAGLPVAAVYTSDLTRALDTARAIAQRHGLEVSVDPDLREIDQGEWTGLTTEEIKARWPELWGPARHYSARPGGESPDALQQRALGALRRIVAAHPEGTVVVVSHGGTIRTLSAAALGYEGPRAARIRGLGNGASVSFDAHLAGDSLVFDGFRRLDGNTPDLDDPND